MEFFTALLNNDTFKMFAAVLAVALANWIVKQFGNKGEKLAKDMATMKKDDAEFKRTYFEVTDHQNAGIRALLEVAKGRNNGNVDKALDRMDSADKATQSYLVTAATKSETDRA